MITFKRFDVRRVWERHPFGHVRRVVCLYHVQTGTDEEWDALLQVLPAWHGLARRIEGHQVVEVSAGVEFMADLDMREIVDRALGLLVAREPRCFPDHLGI